MPTSKKSPRKARQCYARVELENSASANFHSNNTLDTPSLQRSLMRHRFGVYESAAENLAGNHSHYVLLAEATVIFTGGI